MFKSSKFVGMVSSDASKLICCLGKLKLKTCNQRKNINNNNNSNNNNNNNNNNWDFSIRTDSGISLLELTEQYKLTGQI